MNQKNRRERLAQSMAIQSLKPENSDNDELQTSRQKQRGRKKVKKGQIKMCMKFSEIKQNDWNLQRKIEKYGKEKPNSKTNRSKNLQPISRTKLRTIIKGRKIHNEVKERSLYLFDVINEIGPYLLYRAIARGM